MSLIGKILTRLFALFGMTLTCVACYGIPEAEFHPEFGASGRVVDPEGNGIEGIEVSIDRSVTTSDQSGWFYIDGDTPEVLFRDIDGEAHGGEFEELRIEIGTVNNVVELGDVELKRK